MSKGKEMLKAKPIRIQRKRTKGWRMPPNTVYVGRPSRWGNPYTHPNRQVAIGQYKTLVYGSASIIFAIKKKLKGKNLCCWCPLDQPCHADVLLKIANSNAKSK